VVSITVNGPEGLVDRCTLKPVSSLELSCQVKATCKAGLVVATATNWLGAEGGVGFGPGLGAGVGEGEGPCWFEKLLVDDVDMAGSKAEQAASDTIVLKARSIAEVVASKEVKLRIDSILFRFGTLNLQGADQTIENLWKMGRQSL
jgi:hypothetical protein